MQSLSASSLLPVIQLAITPVIFISGMGGVMITLTNRMARVVDRTRILSERLRLCTTSDERVHHDYQLRIMVKRAYHIRLAIMLNGFSMLSGCLQVAAIFLDALIWPQLAPLMMFLFAASITLLIASLISFLCDVQVSLAALQIEVEWAQEQNAKNSPQVPPRPVAAVTLDETPVPAQREQIGKELVRPGTP